MDEKKIILKIWTFSEIDKAKKWDLVCEGNRKKQSHIAWSMILDSIDPQAFLQGQFVSKC